ncbi:hypothetical protein PIB30_085688 [Stylosanthes scabra]|uniref:TF-B3 domain-containing protein n=1 Tax=Stylosanthes scabra TaxID=79078 RepID=A0ABU6YQH5_9FABA|nr:hypothetical protein [Stylosanthes scabra]
MQYIPAPFSRAMIRTAPGISYLCNVIVTPSHPSNPNFKFQLLPSEGRVEFKLGGDWQFFCKGYPLRYQRHCNISIFGTSMLPTIGNGAKNLMRQIFLRFATIRQVHRIKW